MDLLLLSSTRRSIAALRSHLCLRRLIAQLVQHTCSSTHTATLISSRSVRSVPRRRPSDLGRHARVSVPIIPYYSAIYRCDIGPIAGPYDTNRESRTCVDAGAVTAFERQAAKSHSTWFTTYDVSTLNLSLVALSPSPAEGFRHASRRDRRCAGVS